jgi:hypothetical protein
MSSPKERNTMRKLLYGLLMATTLTTTALAVTAAPVWDFDDDLRLDNSALGTWCVASIERWDGKNTRIYERNQNCLERYWIVIGPRSYRTSDRQCDMISVARANKNLIMQYRCTAYETNKVWTERAEFGFTGSEYLYIIRS